MEDKICKKCGVLQPIENFKVDRYINKQGLHNRLSSCKECNSKAAKKYSIGYRQEHAKEIKLLQKNYRIKNKKKHCEDNKRYYQRSKEKVLSYQKKYRENNLEKIKAYKKEYNCSEEFKANRRKKYNTDLEYKLSVSLRGSLRRSVLYNCKKSSALKLLGCSIPEFRQYIEKQIKPGMSWDKWGLSAGKFHLDHVLPVASFDLMDIEQQKICFHYTNFQPLWSHENWSKCDKIERDGKIINARHIRKII